MEKISCGIVLYNPEINRLKENIYSIKEQVDNIVFFDNGSKNINEIRKNLLSINKNFKIISSNKNRGIAYALNKIAQYAIDNGYNWLLTLDQDTVVSKNLVSIYRKYLNLPRVGQLACLYTDRNADNKVRKNKKQAYQKVKYCITSGTLINLEALKKVGGYDEQLFIDWVDNEICCRLRTFNYETYVINFYGFLQEMGHIKENRILFKKIYTPNYNPIRYYYNARNSIYVSRKYSDEKVYKIIFNQLKMATMISVFENEKLKKVKAIFTGIKDGFKID